MRLVLLHSPLVGPGTWRLLSPVLEQKGFQVAVVDFRPEIARQPPYYVRLVGAVKSAVASGQSAKNILVVHSGAGSLVPAVVAESNVAGAIFVDALLPHANRSWFSTISDPLKAHLTSLAHDDHLPPWHRWWGERAIRSLFDDDESYEQFVAELPEIPLAFLSEPAPASELPEYLACAYLQLGPGNAPDAATAERLGWPVRRLPLHHLAVLTRPLETATALAELAGELSS